jgi:von Willebrand factor type D domain
LVTFRQLSATFRQREILDIQPIADNVSIFGNIISSFRQDLSETTQPAIGANLKFDNIKVTNEDLIVGDVICNANKGQAPYGQRANGKFTLARTSKKPDPQPVKVREFTPEQYKERLKSIPRPIFFSEKQIGIAATVITAVIAIALAYVVVAAAPALVAFLENPALVAETVKTLIALGIVQRGVAATIEGVPHEKDDDKKDPTPTPTLTPNPRPIPPLRCTSCGDPHLTTLDGQRYDHQAVGEFVLTRTKNRQFEIQVREAPYKNVKTASINSAVAMKVGDARVGIYTAGFPDDQTKIPLRIDGKPVDLKGTQNLAGGGAVTQIGDRSWTVQWPTGEVATFQIEEAGGSKMINISTGVTENDRGQMEGLLGNFNGNPSDDFMTRDGRVIEENKEAMNVARSVLSNFNISQYIPIQLDKATELFLESIHNEFGDSWRITQSESLFDYPSGKNTDSFTNRAFPNGFVVLRMLAPQAVQMAEEACRKAEVPSDRLEGCLFDVAVTGEADFASVAANILKNEVKKRLEQEIRQRIPLPVPLPF